MITKRILYISIYVLVAMSLPLLGQTAVLMMSFNDSLYLVDLKTAEYRKINVQLNQSADSLRGNSDSPTASKTLVELTRWIWLQDSTVYASARTRNICDTLTSHRVYAVPKSQIVSGTISLESPLYEAPSGCLPMHYRGFTVVPFRRSGDSAMDCLLTHGEDVIDTLLLAREKFLHNAPDIVGSYSWLNLDTNLLDSRIERYRAQRGESSSIEHHSDTVIIYNRVAGALVVAIDGIAVDTMRIPCEPVTIVEKGCRRLTLDVKVSNVYNGCIAASVYIGEIDNNSQDNNKHCNDYQYLAIIDINRHCSYKFYSIPLFGYNSIVLLP
jgi:hypothetical protein